MVGGAQPISPLLGLSNTKRMLRNVPNHSNQNLPYLIKTEEFYKYNLIMHIHVFLTNFESFVSMPTSSEKDFFFAIFSFYSIERA